MLVWNAGAEGNRIYLRGHTPEEPNTPRSPRWKHHAKTGAWRDARESAGPWSMVARNPRKWRTPLPLRHMEWPESAGGTVPHEKGNPRAETSPFARVAIPRSKSPYWMTPMIFVVVKPHVKC